ncbi:MAG: AcrR family transcriptional regulator [Cyclobacteriaceae bacterium]|jgi:AcrR family transcriptional regulator
MRLDTTEEKIKSAARTIFMKKGYAATKTRDIADHAGINLALVNYYFRSKEKLFHEIMMESMQGFFSNIVKVIFDETTSLEHKLEQMASGYIDMFISQPNMPIFVLSELQSNPEKFVDEMANRTQIKHSVFFKQLLEKAGIDHIHMINPAHIFINFMGLMVFPFVAKPMLMSVTELDQEHFNQLMQERKKLIPMWIMNMLE